MADELTVAMSLVASKGAKRESFNKGSFLDDMSGTDFVRQTQLAAVGEAPLDKGGVTTPGWFIGRNNDTTDSIHIRPATSLANMVTIPPGCTVCFKFVSSATAPYIVASANTPELEYLLVEA